MRTIHERHMRAKGNQSDIANQEDNEMGTIHKRSFLGAKRNKSNLAKTDQAR